MRFFVFIFVAALIFSTQIITAEETAENENFGLIIEADKENNERTIPKICKDKKKSYEKYVARSNDYTRSSESRLKAYLECWKDPKVVSKLADLYVKQKRYYAAGLLFKDAGMIDKFNEMEKLRFSVSKKEKIDFQRTSFEKSMQYHRKYRNLMNFSIASIVIGSISSAAGFSLFIHDNAFNGTNSKIAQYSLIFGGLSFISSGITSNFFAHLAQDRAQAYRYISENIDEISTTPDDYYIYSGKDDQIRYENSKRLTAHGTALIFASVPIFIFSFYSFFDSYNYLTDKYEKEKKERDTEWEESEEHDLGDAINQMITETISHSSYIYTVEAAHLTLSISLIPAFASLAGGIIMLVKASKWKKLDTKESVFVLNSITPVIDPVSKTYGLSMGFSF